MTTAVPAVRENAVASVRSRQPLERYLRVLAGPAPGARLLEIRFALRHRDMGRLFIAAHSASGAGAAHPPPRSPHRRVRRRLPAQPPLRRPRRDRPTRTSRSSRSTLPTPSTASVPSDTRPR